MLLNKYFWRNPTSTLLQLLKKYAPVLRFIFTFAGAYLLLAVLYQFYLQNFTASPPDYLTQLVATQSESLVTAMGYTAEVQTPNLQSALQFNINGKLVAQIIEGCNAVSVLILFVSFMIAFWGKGLLGFLYTFAGIALIYAVNILRIALMAVGIYEYPQHTVFLHNIVFPLIIYGLVFMLWVGWIITVSKQHKSWKWDSK